MIQPLGRTSFLDHLDLFFRPPTARAASAVEAEIAEEIEFHLALRARDNAEAGMSDADARAAALSCFGDVERIRSACRRIQIGERTMLQRWNAGATAILLVIAAYLGWQLASSRSETAAMVESLRADIGSLAQALRASERAREGLAASGGRNGDLLVALGERTPSEPEAESARVAAPKDPSTWLERFPPGLAWRDAHALGQELAALDPEQALAVMEAIYRDIPDASSRQQILKAFVFDGGHPMAVRVLHLAATDLEPAVQGWAYQYLESYAFQDLSEDHQAYLDWYARFGHLPLPELLERNARELALRLHSATTAELDHALSTLDELDLEAGPAAGVDLAAIMKESGLLAPLGEALRTGGAEARGKALEWLAELGADEPFLRAEVLPLLGGGAACDEVSVSAACLALGRPGNGFALEPLLESLRRTRAEEPGRIYAHAMALAEIGDARAIPPLIALLAADGTETTIYGIGYYALRDLTGVSYDESHDAAFWTRWWEENRARLPEEVRNAEIPALAFQR